MIKFDVHGSLSGGAARRPTGDGRTPSDVSLFQGAAILLEAACLCLTWDTLDKGRRTFTELDTANNGGDGLQATERERCIETVCKGMFLF